MHLLVRFLILLKYTKYWRIIFWKQVFLPSIVWKYKFKLRTNSMTKLNGTTWKFFKELDSKRKKNLTNCTHFLCMQIGYIEWRNSMVTTEEINTCPQYFQWLVYTVWAKCTIHLILAIYALMYTLLSKKLSRVHFVKTIYTFIL